MKTNLKNMAWMLAATLVMAACSDSLDESSGNGNSNEYVGTKGYVRVAINTPTTSGNITRANDQDYDADSNPNPDIKFEDGTADEYKITDGVIVFFKTTKASDQDSGPDPDTQAKFVSAYKLTDITTQGDPSSQVTEKVVTVTEAPMVDKTKEKLYALVILNVPATVVSVDADNHSLTLNGTALGNTATLSDFTNALTNQDLDIYIGENQDDFTMCNAPLSTVEGTSGSNMANAAAKTLVPVEVYPTENEARSHDAARIYVERVVAKVTLTGFDYDNSAYTKDVEDNNGIYNGDEVTLEGWLLNVTNKSTKLVRDVSGYEDGSWLATAATGATNEITRFAGTSVIPIDFSGTNYFRIYWAEDGNYNTATSETDFTTYYNDQDGTINPNNSPKDEDWNANTADNETDNPVKDYALYCLENTMDYSNQVKNQTTSVLLKTVYKVKFEGQSNPSQQNFFICGANPTKYPEEKITLDGGSEIDGICKVVTEAANKVLDSGNTIADDALTLIPNAKAGIYNSKDKLKELFALANENDEKWSAIWNQVGTIRYYEGGISYYYAARIRHFNDDETDWNDGGTYGIQHLGRYGVVRNNWYEVNINKITGPGEPVIVKPDGGANDEAEGYIRAEINVLSWAKRSQSVDL